MNVNVAGLAVWGRGLTSYDDLLRVMQTGGLPDGAEFIAPKPEAIPSRERRRAGLMINLAVTLAHQACEHAGVDKSLVPSVFASGMGDTDITDYMCRKLAQPDKMLSPTKFHNSVHNAPSGYWTISANNRAPSTFVGGYDYSVGAGLIEAASQALAANQPVLLVAYDIVNRPPFSEICPAGESFGAAVVLAPIDWPAAGAGLNLRMDLVLESVAAASDTQPSPGLKQVAAGNPSAVSLALLEQLAAVQEGQDDRAALKLRAAPQLELHLGICPAAG